MLKSRRVSDASSGAAISSLKYGTFRHISASPIQTKRHAKQHNALLYFTLLSTDFARGRYRDARTAGLYCYQKATPKRDNNTPNTFQNADHTANSQVRRREKNEGVKGLGASCSTAYLQVNTVGHPTYHRVALRLEIDSSDLVIRSQPFECFECNRSTTKR